MIIFFYTIVCIIEAFRVSILFLRKDKMIVHKIFEVVVLVSMIILFSYIIEDINTLVLSIILIILCVYVIISFVYEFIYKKDYITVLSVKNAIDKIDNGILFFDNNNILLINNTMKYLLDEFNIDCNYSNNLLKVCNDNILRSKMGYFEIYTNSDSIYAVNITDIYTLQERTRLKNCEIENNNKRLRNTINNVKKISKEKNVLRLKNEYHDLLGHRLALFTKYLECNNINKKDIEFLLDSINVSFDKDKSASSRLDDLIKMYKMVGIDINLDGVLKVHEDIAKVMFEVIREGVTNAIIHSGAKKIDVSIKNKDDEVLMIISNKLNNSIDNMVINEGICGMIRKLSLINGTLDIITNDKFILKVKIKLN